MANNVKAKSRFLRASMRLVLAALFCFGFVVGPFSMLAQANSGTQQEGTVMIRTAFFYADPQVLNTEQHRDLRFEMPKNAAFAANVQAVPILLSEFGDVALEYPIVFAKNSDASWIALALTGLQQDQNVFVDGNGDWNAKYIPASVRRYPFVLAEGEDGTLNVAVDMILASESNDSVRLFDEDGNPAEILQNAIVYLQAFQDQYAQTDALITKFEELGLLTEAQFRIQDREGNERSLDGFFIVEEASLNTLNDGPILDLFRRGEVSALVLQLLSLKNITELQLREAISQ